MDSPSKKKGTAEAGSHEYASFGDLALRPGFAWEGAAWHGVLALLVCGLLLFLPPRRGRHGPLLPMPPFQLFLARACLVGSAGLLVLRLVVRDQVWTDPELGEVRRVRRLGTAEQPLARWAREDLVAVSVQCIRATRGEGVAADTGSGLPRAWYRAVFVTRFDELVPFTRWAWVDLLGTNTLAEEMASRMQLPVLRGEVFATARLGRGPDGPRVAMEPAIQPEDYTSPVHWVWWVTGGTYWLITLVAKMKAGGF